MVAKEIRTRTVGTNCISWTVGMCILPLLADLCRDWRILGLLTTCCCIPFLASGELPIATTALTIIGKCGYIGAYLAMYQQATELHPTPLRALGMGTIATIACVTTICAPHIVYLFPFLDRLFHHHLLCL
ncbi:solute carrier family 22 member 13-like [Tachypleus tridentatus]|uniref:solute carrier family 22 member 13-like n=1 Tax=Tachypleus tridentatus TaxID=6853 RepID=UPI003FCF2742